MQIIYSFTYIYSYIDRFLLNECLHTWTRSKCWRRHFHKHISHFQKTHYSPRHSGQPPHISNNLHFASHTCLWPAHHDLHTVAITKEIHRLLSRCKKERFQILHGPWAFDFVLGEALATPTLFFVTTPPAMHKQTWVQVSCQISCGCVRVDAVAVTNKSHMSRLTCSALLVALHDQIQQIWHSALTLSVRLRLRGSSCDILFSSPKLSLSLQCSSSKTNVTLN